MNEISILVETVTPLFIAGADQRNIKNEDLRVPSLRGLLRWWFRAIMGGVYYSSGNLNLKIISKEEKKIWGSTDRKSNVCLTIKPLEEYKIQLYGVNDKIDGVKYLSYGLFNRSYIEPSSQFEIRLSFRPFISNDDIKKVVAVLWLLTNLGNVGSRNRRGFGSLKIVKDTTIGGLKFRAPNTLEELADYIEKNLKECLKIFGWKESKNKDTGNEALPPYSVLTPKYWKLKILSKQFKSPIRAMDWIGKRIREYRRNNIISGVTKDYNTLKRIICNGEKPTGPIYGSIFGLPHQFLFRSQRNKKVIIKGTKHNRRASPLFIKIWKLENNQSANDQFVIGLQLFKSQFLPENKLKIIDKNNPKKSIDVDLPSYNYLENFLNQLDGRWITP